MITNRGISGVPSISSSLNKCRDPLVGLEYLLEIINVPNERPSYFVCILCDAEMATFLKVKDHMTSVEHRVYFLKTHFPRSLRPAERLLRTKECVTFPSPWMVDRIKCLCSDVESRHDRLKASVADYDGFCKNRDKWISNIRGGVHFIEDLVFTRFTKTDVNQQLRLLGILDDKVVEERPKPQTAILLEEYCKRYTQMSKEVMKNQKKYQEDPQSHPLYPAEWDIFWKARSKELEKEGKDPYEHDFTREWSLHWLKRMQQLDKESIELRAKQIRAKLNMPEGMSTKDVVVNDSREVDGIKLTNLEHPIVSTKNENNKRPSKFDVRADGKRIHVEPVKDSPRPELDLRHTLPRSNPVNQSGSLSNRDSHRTSNRDRVTNVGRPDNGSRSSLQKVTDVAVDQCAPRSDRNGSGRDANKDRQDDKSRSRPSGSNDDRNERRRDGSEDRRKSERSHDRRDAESRSALKKESDISTRHGGTNSERNGRERNSGTDRHRDRLNDADVSVRQSESNGNTRAPVATSKRPTADSKKTLEKPNTTKHQSGSKTISIIDLVQEEAESYFDRSEVGKVSQNDTDLREVPMEIEAVPPASEFDGDNCQDPVTVISVLRLLAAFEDLLGNSLGPKVVDLLSKAVALEKVRENLSDDLLVSEDNNILLETVKEKMKGLLLTGSVEAFKVPSVRKVIAHVNKINHIIGMRVKARQKQAMADARQNLEVAKLKEQKEKEMAAAEFRKDVHHQLSTSIALQGKLITPDQLETLTNIYIQKHTVNDTPYTFGLAMGPRFPDIPRDGSNYLPELKQRQDLLDHKFDFLPSAEPNVSHWSNDIQQPKIPPIRSVRNDIHDSIQIREEEAFSRQYENDHRRLALSSEIDLRHRQTSPDRQNPSTFHSQRVITMGGGRHQRTHDFNPHDQYNDDQPTQNSVFNRQISVDFDNNYQQQQQFPDEFHHHRQTSEHFGDSLENPHRRPAAYDRGERMYPTHESDQRDRQYQSYEEDLQRQRREMRMQMHREVHEAKLMERHREMSARYNSNGRDRHY